MDTVLLVLFGLMMLFGCIECLCLIAGYVLVILKWRDKATWALAYQDALKFERVIRWSFIGSTAVFLLCAGL